MTDLNESLSINADIWVDPACPFAWQTSRWIIEVEKVRPIRVQWNIMSLAILNAHREGLSKEYREKVAKALAPVRVIIAASQRHGSEYIKALYDAMGFKRHVQKIDDWKEIIIQSLQELNLPADLAEFGYRDDYDSPLQLSHDAGISSVGQDVGTPIVSFNGVSFFGPVITRVPLGEDAGKMWDASVMLASFPYFFEIKRSRTESPQL